jgi:predicted PurR-regulated permease PerM
MPAIKLPVFVKAALFIIGVYALINVLLLAHPIIVPAIFAFIIATMLNPVVNFFERLKIPRVLAIAITIILAIAVAVSFGAIIASQATSFSSALPKLSQRLSDLLNQVSNWATVHFHISQKSINSWVNSTKTELIHNSSAFIGNTIASVGSLVIVCVLIPVYVFMVLYYKSLILEGIRRFFGEKHEENVNEVLSEIQVMFQHYLVGLIIEATIVGSLFSIGLLILGVDYAILLGFIAAILNVIPYLGGIIAVTIIVIFTLITKDSATYALFVILIYIFIHFLDNTFIVPKIVASKVKINALVSLTVVFTGSALWGVPGMFLSIPLTAVVKLVFDHIDSLKPLGYLLGDEMPDDFKRFRFRFRRKKPDKTESK